MTEKSPRHLCRNNEKHLNMRIETISRKKHSPSLSKGNNAKHLAALVASHSKGRAPVWPLFCVHLKFEKRSI